MNSPDRPIEKWSGKVPSGAASQPDETVTVLLVEDDDLVLEVATVVLTQQGYTVVQATDGDDAVRVMNDAPDLQIDLLLTDFFMPSISGTELAVKFREVHPGARVLFMSGYPQSEIFGDCELGPMDGFIQKPFTPSVLSDNVREIVDRPSPI